MLFYRPKLFVLFARQSDRDGLTRSDYQDWRVGSWEEESALEKRVDAFVDLPWHPHNEQLMASSYRRRFRLDGPAPDFAALALNTGALDSVACYRSKAATEAGYAASPLSACPMIPPATQEGHGFLQLLS
jgi:hypothetical protein